MTFYDPLPYSVEYDGRIYKLTPAFDNVLKMYALLDGLMDYEKVEVMLSWLVKGHYPVDGGLLTAVCKVLFPECKTKESQKAFDYIQDSDYIYAAFRQAYNIDLYAEQGKMHWLQFSALMTSLPQNTRFSEIVHIRLMPIPKPTKNNAEQRAEIIKLKQEYALTITDEERQNNLQQGLRKMAEAMLARVKDGS